MKAKRRRIRHVTTLEAMTDDELRDVYFFSFAPLGYPLQKDDWRRAGELLRERGFFDRDPVTGKWVRE